MALPQSRNITYAIGDPVRHVDLNAIQDMIIALFAGAHGPRTIAIAPGGAGGDAVSGATGGSLSINNNLDLGIVPVALPVGSRVLAIRVRVTDNATGTTRLTATFSSKVDLNSTQVATVQSAGNGADQTITMAAINQVLAAGTAYFVRLTINASNQVFVHRIEVDYDCP